MLRSPSLPEIDIRMLPGFPSTSPPQANALVPLSRAPLALEDKPRDQASENAQTVAKPIQLPSTVPERSVKAFNVDNMAQTITAKLKGMKETKTTTKATKKQKQSLQSIQKLRKREAQRAHQNRQQQ